MIHTEKTEQALGLNSYSIASRPDMWNYASLANPPVVQSAKEPKMAASMYRGIVPVQNLFEKDFAVNGSIVRELCSHAMSSDYADSSPQIMGTLSRSCPIGFLRTSSKMISFDYHLPSMMHWQKHK